MNIAFRTDATSQIGTGHFMRCPTLADALKRQDATIRFVSRNLPGQLSEMLKAKGMDIVALPKDVFVRHHHHHATERRMSFILQ